MDSPFASKEVVLTRYLYILDEVLYTLKEVLLKGKDFNEVVFWAGEIIYSGLSEELWQFIFYFNYSFLAIVYPKYETKLYKLYKLFTNENEKHLSKFKTIKNGFITVNISDLQLEYCINALSILFNSKKNFLVFNKWHQAQKTIDNIYSINTPEWLKKLKIDKKYFTYLRSIKNKNFKNIAFYLKTKYFDIDNLYKITIKYFKEVKNIGIKPKNINISQLPYRNKEHIIMTLICHMLTDEKNIEKRSIFTICDTELHIKQLKIDNEPINIAYKTLSNKYRYPISNTIGCFPLARNSFKNYRNIKEVFWFFWKYYTYNCPVWRERYNKYNIIIDNKKKDILFQDYQNQEDFDDNYYYETDEQTIQVQNMSVPEIPPITLQAWKKLII